MGRVVEVLDKLISANKVVDPGLSSTLEEEDAPVTRAEFNNLIEKLNSLLGRAGDQILISIPAVDLSGGTLDIGSTSTAPGLPTSVSTVAGFQLAIVKWTIPTDKFFDEVEVYRSDDNDSDNASIVGSVRGNFIIDDKLGNRVTRYYWLKARSFDGTLSAFHAGQTSGVSVTTLDIKGADVNTSEAIITNIAQITNAIVRTAHIATANITEALIGTAAVIEAKIGTAAVTEAKIGSLAVTNAKIGALAVDTAEIADLAVETLQVAGTAITEPKITDNSTTDVSLTTSSTQQGLSNSAWAEVLEVIHTASGKPLEIHARCEYSRTSAATLQDVGLRILEGSTIIATEWRNDATFNGSGSTDGPALSIVVHRTPASGSVTYNLEAHGFQGSNTIRAEIREIGAVDWKK